MIIADNCLVDIMMLEKVAIVSERPLWPGMKSDESGGKTKFDVRQCEKAMTLPYSRIDSQTRFYDFSNTRFVESKGGREHVAKFWDAVFKNEWSGHAPGWSAGSPSDALQRQEQQILLGAPLQGCRLQDG